MADAPIIPNEWPEVAEDFTGPCLIEVRDEWRQGRARYWCANGCGYTNQVHWAGVYTAEKAKAICLRSERHYPVNALAVFKAHVAALETLKDQIAALTQGEVTGG